MNKIEEIKTKANTLISAKESCDLIEYCNQLESLLSDAIRINDVSQQYDISYLLSKDIVSNTLSGIYVYHLEDVNDDHSLRMVYANPITEKITGVKCKDVVGKTLDENFPVLREKGIPQAYANVVRTGKSFEVEDLYYGDKQVVTGAFLVKAFPLPDNHIGVSFENVSKTKQYQQKIEEHSKNLKEQNEEYEAANEELSEANQRLHAALQELEQSETRFKELIENIKYGVVVYEPFNEGEDFIIKSINKGGEHIDKINREDILGKKVTEIFPGVKEFGIFDVFYEVFKTGKSKVFPLNLYKDNRIQGWRENYIFRLPNKEVVAVYEDLTEQKLVEKKLKQQNKEYLTTNKELIESRLKLEEAQAMGHIGHYNFNVLSGHWTNSKILDEIFGIDENFERTLEGWRKMMHPEDCDYMIEYLLNDAIGKQKKFDKEYRIINQKTGKVKWVHGKGNLDINNKGEVVTMFGTIQDITDHKKWEFKILENEKALKEKNEEYLSLNEELQEANNQMYQINKELLEAKIKAEESDKLKTAFLANMSHEIRTPMNGIIGFANLLTSEDLTQDKKEHYTQIINNSANQLLTIISDIIDISKIEANQLDIVNKKFKIKPLLNELKEHLDSEKIRKEKEHIEIICETPGEEIEIITDEIRTKQILSNLLNNALKFTEKGKIKFGYYFNDNDEIIFFVEDTGISISQENLETIFERFRQEEDSNNRKFGGTGLGLSICKGLVNKLGGKIWAESYKNVGSKFYFSLETHDKVKKIKEKPEVETISKDTDLTGKKILLVEDMEISRILVNEIIEPTGANLIMTDSGLESIELCKEHDPDIILMDIQLPDINGYEAVKEIRKFNKDVIIIAQTAFAMSGDDVKSYDAGCNDYISKPYNRLKMIKLLNKHFNKS